MSREAVGTGVLTGGKIAWDDQRGFTDQLSFMKDGSVVVRVELVRPRTIRAIKVNRYYWGHVLRLIAEHTGDDVDDVHDYMCARFLTRRVALINTQTGEVDEMTVAGHSSKLSPEEFWEFVLKVRLFAAEFLQVETHDPDPAWREKQEAA